MVSIFEKTKNRNKVENQDYSLGLLQQSMMISIAGHHDRLMVCQARAYQIVGQQKSGPLQPVGAKGGRRVRVHSSHPLPYGPELSELP